MSADEQIIDIHAHLLAGIDDGPATAEESLHMCELYLEQGVGTVVATPHAGNRRYSVDAARVLCAVEELQRACRVLGLGLRILPGCDAQLQPALLQMFDAGELLTVADSGAYLLLELPAQALPRIEGLVADLLARGTTPILTHPERNPEFLRRPDRLAQLVACGCLVQATAGSYLGLFGSAARRAAVRFLQEGLVHVVASDAHAALGRRGPCLDRAYDRLAALAGPQVAATLLQENPRRIIRGEPALPCTEGAARAQTSAPKRESSL